jgi:predicted CXXCH cytochrome family protein
MRLNTAALRLMVLATVISACTKTEYVERDPVNPPPDAASGFVGYYDNDTKLTTCGNCHSSTQAAWVQTAHADAWDALPTPQGANCVGCHTVNEKGNAATGPAGYSVVQDAAYHDVQCESCHSPGYTHATTPDAGTPPLANMGMYDPTATCASCHSGGHHPFAEQWAASGHNDSVGMASPASNPSCVGCHEGKAAIQRFSGATSRYRDSVGTKTIVCTVCHDPHGSPNTAQLRAPIDVPDVTVNLCMRCHLRNAVPSSSFTRGQKGAHSAQGPVLLGEGAGWIPPGFYFDSAGAYSSHGSSLNPRLCAGCHVNAFSANDSAGGTFNSTGHNFFPIPCVDGTGVPINGPCAYTSGARNWSSCTNAGCHADASVAANFFNLERTAVNNLVDVLWKDKDGDRVLDALPTDSGYLPTVYANTPAEFNGSNGLTTAEGALWNAMMLGENLHDHPDGSKGVHNPIFYEALLAATIDAMEASYPTLPPPSAGVRATMERALARPAVKFTPRAGSRIAAHR